MSHRTDHEPHGLPTRVVARATARVAVLAMLAGPGCQTGIEHGTLSDHGDGPWVVADSPFPDPGESNEARERRIEAQMLGTPSQEPGEREPGAQGEEGPAADLDAGVPREDLGLPPLPDYMEVKRLPRATADDPEAPREPPPGTGPVARVNGEDIPRQEYDFKVKRTLDAYYGLTRSLPRSVWEQVVGGTLNSMIRATIDRQQARKLGVTISKEEMDEEFRKFVERRGGPRNFPRFLKHMHITEEDIREDIHTELLHEAVLRAALGEIHVTDDEVREHYRKHRYDYYVKPTRHLRHILVKTYEGYDAQHMAVAAAKAAKALAEIRSGKDFAEVAKRYSEGAAAPKGGELGWLHEGQMPEEFDRVAFSMPVGSVSDVVKSPLGFHVIQCLDAKPGHQRVLGEDPKLFGEIRAGILMNERMKRLREIKKKWYGEAKVEYLDPTIEALAKEMARRRKDRGFDRDWSGEERDVVPPTMHRLTAPKGPMMAPHPAMVPVEPKASPGDGEVRR